MSKWTYFKLLDRQHLNMIVRADGMYQEKFDTQKKDWVRSVIMLEYFSDESDTYDMYEEIAENEALSIINGGVYESA